MLVMAIGRFKTVEFEDRENAHSFAETLAKNDTDRVEHLYDMVIVTNPTMLELAQMTEMFGTIELRKAE